MSSNMDERQQVLRPTEAQLRWAQFHRKQRALDCQETVEKMYLTPASPSQVPDACSDDGASTTDESTCSAAKERRPQVSRGRRALLRVSKRNYEQRRLEIQEHGYQCNEEDTAEDDELMMLFAEESLVKKRNRRRKSRRSRAQDEEERFRRFEAAYHALMMSMQQPEHEIIHSSKRWTRSTPLAAVSIDGREYQDLKWGYTASHKKSKETTPYTSTEAPFDRRASWLVHLPARQSTSKKQTPALSSDGELLEPSNLFQDAEELFSPGQLKFNELVNRLQQQTEGEDHQHREAQGRALEFRQRYSHKHSADRMMENGLPEIDEDGFINSPQAALSPTTEAPSNFSFESEFWRSARNMHDTVPTSSVQSKQGVEESKQDGRQESAGTQSSSQGERSSNAKSLQGGRKGEALSPSQVSEGESEFWQQARSMHPLDTAVALSSNAAPGEHPFSALRKQLAAAEAPQPHGVRTFDSESSPESSDSHPPLEVLPEQEAVESQATMDQAPDSQATPRIAPSRKFVDKSLLSPTESTPGSQDLSDQELDDALNATDPDAASKEAAEPTPAPAVRRMSTKVGGMFSNMFGKQAAAQEDELRAVASFRKTQDERRLSNDDATSTSSFRILPDGIRRVVKNFSTLRVQEGEQVVGQEQQSTPGRSTHSREFSPVHGKSLHDKVMEHSPLIGEHEANATIIDTDDTTSDASGSKVNAAARMANLFLSPQIITKRLHQAIRAIEHHNWEQVNYLLSANPWLAEMPDVTTGQYLLHKLALYGAGVALDTGDAVHVEAPAAPEELSLHLIKMFPPSVYKFDQDGNLPLHMAAVSGNQEMILFLGERFPSGASVRNDEGLLPLHMAIQSCSSPAPSADGSLNSPSTMISNILKLFPGAVAVADNDGNLPIHCAAAALHGDLGVEVVYMLLDEADRQVENGLLFRCTERVPHMDDDGSETIATATDVSGAEDDCMYCNLVRNDRGHTPLMVAIRAMAGWDMIKAIAGGPGGRKAVVQHDETQSNALHLLVDENFADPPSILSILRIAPEAATGRNSEGMLPIEVACMNRMPREVIIALVLVDLPIDLDEKEGIKVREGFGGSWCYLTCECDDYYADIVEEVISICSYPQVRELCFAPSQSGGAIITCATPVCRLALRRALRFVGRFEFLGSTALHTDVSLGLKVFEALDFGTEGDESEDGRPVLLRCYSLEKSYLQETATVREYDFDPAFVEDVFEFGVHELDSQSSEVNPQQYCVAIELPTLTLDQVVEGMLKTEDYASNPDMRNRYLGKVCMVLRLIAKAIRHLHELGVVHGDVCLQNCGKFDDKWKLMSSLGTQPVGNRFDSTRMSESSPPETLELLRNIVETRGQEGSSRHVSFKGNVIADTSIDVWAFGKLTYEALTGEPLIQFDPDKATRHDNRALLRLAGWHEGDLRDVVQNLKEAGIPTLGIDLVSHCLLPDPMERPASMNEILDHPFWRDMRASRRSNNK